MSNELGIIVKEGSLKEMTTQLIQHYLDAHINVLKAASILGIGKSTIYRMIEEGELKKPINDKSNNSR